MSPLLSSLVTALIGLAAGTPLVWRQRQQLSGARRRAARSERDAAQARRLAFHDDTTGLPNRRAFLHHLGQALHAGAPTGVVLLDLDNFKAVNDTFGHERGNDLLTCVGLRLADLPNPTVLAARLSGDEFALLVHGDAEQTAVTARAAWQAISAHPVPIDHTQAIDIRASVGYATAARGADIRQVLHQADMAMYGAKRRGGGIGVADTVGTPVLPTGRRLRDLRADRHR